MKDTICRSSRRCAWMAFAAALSLVLPGAALADAGDKSAPEDSNGVEQAAESVQTTAGEVASNVKDATADLRQHASLEAKLAASDELSAFSINTDVENGVAILEGDVSTEAQKALATQLALSVDGILSVRNDLKVTDDPSLSDQIMQEMDDAALTASVKSRLLMSQHTSGLKIDVDTTGHVVTLSGDVDSGTEKELAGLIAENTSGVEAVHNKLVVHQD